MVGMGSRAGLVTEHYISDGARKEKLRQRAYRPARATRRRYAELRCASAFSFLDGASLPEDLVARAAELGLPAVALVDRNGVYGAPRFYKAARRPASGRWSAPRWCSTAAGLGAAERPKRARAGEPVKARARARDAASPSWSTIAPATGISASCSPPARRGKPKGEARVDWEQIAAHAGGLHVPHRRRGGPARARPARTAPTARRGRAACSSGCARIFPGASHVELQRHACARGGAQPGARRARARAPPAARRHQRRALRARGRQAPPRRPHLHPPRHRRSTRAGALLAADRERHLKSAGEMARALRRPARGGRRRRSSSPSARLHARRPRLPLPRLPAAARRDARRPTCASSPGTARARASGRSPRRRRRRSRTSSR